MSLDVAKKQVWSYEGWLTVADFSSVPLQRQHFIVFANVFAGRLRHFDTGGHLVHAVHPYGIPIVITEPLVLKSDVNPGLESLIKRASNLLAAYNLEHRSSILYAIRGNEEQPFVIFQSPEEYCQR